MAKILYSALVSDMRNKLNGSVMARNRYGSYVRTKVTPVNRQSAAQMNQRGQFGFLSANWRELTQEQRDGWNAAAINFPRTDIFGMSRNLSGQALYISLNRNLYNAGAALITDAPVPRGVADLQVAITLATSDGSDFILNQTVAPAALPADAAILVYATPPVSAGREFVKNLYKLIQTVKAADVTAGEFQSGEAYMSVFGNAREEMKVGVQYVTVNLSTGEASAPTSQLVIVAGT